MDEGKPYIYAINNNVYNNIAAIIHSQMLPYLEKFTTDLDSCCCTLLRVFQRLLTSKE